MKKISFFIIAFIALFIHSRNGMAAVAYSSVLKAQNKLVRKNEILLKVYNNYLFFRDANANYIDVVNDCLNNTTYIANSDYKPENEVCRAHYENFDELLKEDLPKLRRYKILSSLGFTFSDNADGAHFFSKTIIRSMIPVAFKNVSFQFLLAKNKVTMATPDRVSEKELAEVDKIIRMHINEACLNFSSEADNLKDIQSIKLGNKALTAATFCQYLQASETKFAPIRGQLNGSDFREWNSIRDSLIKKIKKETLPELMEESEKAYFGLVERSPFLLMVKGESTFDADITEAFRVLQDAEADRIKEETPEIQEIKKLSLDKTSRDSQEKLNSILKKYLNFDFIVQNELLELQKADNKNDSTLLTQMIDSYQTVKTLKHVGEGALMVGGIAACFLPLGRTLGILVFRNLCLFAFNQPMAAYFAFNEYASMNETYKLFLSDPSGRGRFTSFSTVKDKVGSYPLSLLMLPIGTVQTKTIFRELLKKIK
jgi:hypothetical protein